MQKHTQRNKNKTGRISTTTVNVMCECISPIETTSENWSRQPLLTCKYSSVKECEKSRKKNTSQEI